MSTMNVSKKTIMIAKVGMLATISIVLVLLIHVPIFPAVPFLEYDPADIPIILGTFAMGPGAGIILTIIVSVIQGLTVSAASSWYGILMHVIATGTYVLVAGLIYRSHKTRKGALISMGAGICSMTIIMIPANLLLTPIYLQMVGMPKEAAFPMVVTLLGWIVLFNLVKATINSAVTFLLYKRLSPLLHK